MIKITSHINFDFNRSTCLGCKVLHTHTDALQYKRHTKLINSCELLLQNLITTLQFIINSITKEYNIIIFV